MRYPPAFFAYYPLATAGQEQAKPRTARHNNCAGGM